MAVPANENRPKIPESEKITINLGFVDLGQIDLLVSDGFYANRTDFIRTAIRNQLGRHDEVVRKAAARKQLDLGLRYFSRADLEALRVLGLASIASDVSPQLALQTIESITVLGALHASPAVKAALGERIR